MSINGGVCGKKPPTEPSVGIIPFANLATRRVSPKVLGETDCQTAKERHRTGVGWHFHIAARIRASPAIGGSMLHASSRATDNCEKGEK